MKRIFDHLRDHLWLKCLGHEELANATCLRYPWKLTENCTDAIAMELFERNEESTVKEDMELYRMLGINPPPELVSAFILLSPPAFATSLRLPHIQGLPDTSNQFFAEDIRDAVAEVNQIGVKRTKSPIHFRVASQEAAQRRDEAEKRFARVKRSNVKLTISELDVSPYQSDAVVVHGAVDNATNLQKGIDAGLVIVPPKRGRGRPSKKEIEARQQAVLADDDSWL